MGGHALRDGALDDAETVAFVAENLVPVWVNVRKEELPAFPARDEVLVGTRLSEEGKVKDLGSQGFFLRWLVLDPRDLELLNPQAPSPEGSVKQLLTEGAFAYAQVRPRQVRRVLDDALRTYRSRPLASPRDGGYPAE